MLKTRGNERGSLGKICCLQQFNCYLEKEISHFRENKKGIFFSTVDPLCLPEARSKCALQTADF
jgi:hypothetical protein